MYSDFHIHTKFSFDSETPVRDQIEKAIELSMDTICFTDHHDYDAPKDLAPMLLDTEPYFQEIKQLKEEFAGRISIRTGVELGLQSHLKDYLEKYSNEWSFDFIIGSCHLIDGYDPYFPEFFEIHEEEKGYQRYFEYLLENIKLHNCYDVLGHIDYVVRYGPNKNQYYSYNKYRDLIDEILKTAIQKHKGIEINTGGFKYGLGHPNPHEDIIKRYLELGGEIITLGSDGHRPEHLGYDFHKLPEFLSQLGVKYYTIFKNRKPEFIRI